MHMPDAAAAARLHVPRLGRPRGAAPARARDEHDAHLRARRGRYTACAWRERWRARERRCAPGRHYLHPDPGGQP